MVYIRSRKFCCCLPVRIGVFLIGILGIIGGGVVAAAGWLEVKNLKDHPQTQTETAAIYVQTFMYTILALVSLFGLIGSIIKQLRFIRLYSSILAIHLGFSIASGIFSMYSMFHKDSPEAMAKCINGSTEQSVKDACSKGLAIWKGIEVAIFVITWLIELYGCIIVANYAEQLEEEEASKMPKKASASTVTPFATYTAFTPNNNVQGQYAFSTTNQSFGQSGQNA